MAPDRSILMFDSTTRIDFAEDAAVTSHPIEDGSAVTDHVQRLPRTLALTGIISASTFQESVTSGVDREQTAKDFFEEIWGQEVLVVTARFGVLPGYTLRRLTSFIDNRKRTVFSAEFIRVEKATSEAVTVDSSDSQVSSGFDGGSDVGEQSTSSNAGAPAAETDSSALYSLTYGG
jgi:hypothetical protein